MRVGVGVFKAGSDFPSERMHRLINSKGAHPLVETLRVWRERFPADSRSAQVLVDVDNKAVVESRGGCFRHKVVREIL